MSDADEKVVAKAPAKIITHEDFQKTCEVLRTTDVMNTRNDLAVKVEEYIRKGIVDLTDSKKKESIPQLLEFLMLVDRDLPAEVFFKGYGQELFAIFFKVTYYDLQTEYSVNNIQGGVDNGSHGIGVGSSAVDKIVDDHENL